MNALTAGAVLLSQGADISVPALVYERLGLEYRSPFASSPIVEIEPDRDP